MRDTVAYVLLRLSTSYYNLALVVSSRNKSDDIQPFIGQL